MLRIIRIIGMTLVSMLALSGVASAHVFESTVTGNIKAVKNGTQVFKTLPTGGTPVECTKVTVTKGTAQSGAQLHILAEIFYSGCTVTAFKFEAKITTAKYLFSADLLAALENTISITVPIANCAITVKPQDLWTVKYLNSGNNIIVDPEVTGILSEASGGECGTTGHMSTGTYTGSTEVEVVGGKIKWA
jgi:hypothetical protein